MNRMLLQTNRFFENLPDQLRNRKWVVWILFLVLLVGALGGTSRMKMNMAMDSFFPEDEPVKQAYNRFRALFGSDETMYLVYKAKDGDVFSERSLKALADLQDELFNAMVVGVSDENSPFRRITEIKSLINVDYMEVKGDVLSSSEFIGADLPQTEAERELLRTKAKDHPNYPLLYFSEDFRFGGLLVKTDFNAQLAEEFQESGSGFGPEKRAANLDEIRFEKTELKEYDHFMQTIRPILEQQKYQDVFEFYPVGNPPFMANAFVTMTTEGGMLMGGVLLLIVVSLTVLLRSFFGMLWPVLIVVASILFTLGIAGWSGVAQSNMLEITTFLILAVGIADSIHILSGYLYFRNGGQDHESALRSVFKKSGLACFLTSLTTALGLLSLVFVPIGPVQVFGVFTAAGVMIAFLLTVLILPLLLDIKSILSKKNIERIRVGEAKKHYLQKMLQSLEDFSYRRSLPVAIVFFGVGILMIYGMTRITIDTNNVESMKEGTPIRTAYELVDEVLAGTGNIEILIKTGREDGLKDYRMLKAMEDLQDRLENKIGGKLTRTFSLVDYVKESYKALNENRPEMLVLPNDPDVLAQTLFLFEMSNADDRRQLATDDFSTARIGVTTKNLGSKDGVEMIEKISQEIEVIFGPLRDTYPSLDVQVTGQVPLLNKLADFISWSQFRSFGLALAVISVLLPFVLGSLRVGLIAVLPNLFPILLIFGLMGLLGVPLEMHLLLVAPITIGIAVDDTIHFLTHYQLETARGASHKDALTTSIREVGQAVTFTSLILSIGFLIFLISTNAGFFFFGIFSAVAIAAAWLGDIFLLPALLTLFGGKRG